MISFNKSKRRSFCRESFEEKLGLIPQFCFASAFHAPIK